MNPIRNIETLSRYAALFATQTKPGRAFDKAKAIRRRKISRRSRAINFRNA